MLTNRRGKVLFIGPAFATIWRGRGILNSEASISAMANMGYRLARIEDNKYMSQADLDQIENEQPVAIIAPLPPVVVDITPKNIAPVVVEADEEDFPLEYHEEPQPKQRRKRITKSKHDAY